MISETNTLSLRKVIDQFASHGRNHFDIRDIQSKLGVPDAAIYSALNRLSKQGLIASPAKGFYVIVPPEYRSLGCLPAEQFIPALMKRQKLTYYAGLLSAAQYHGAAHHRPQEFQVLAENKRRPIKCGVVRVTFVVSKRVAQVQTQMVNTPRGTLKISSPEATAVDLVGYLDQSGGLDMVATLLSELSDRIDPQLLRQAAEIMPITWAQRLGYLMELGEGAEKTAHLKMLVADKARDYTALLSGSPHLSANRSKEWKLFINAKVELEF